MLIPTPMKILTSEDCWANIHAAEEALSKELSKEDGELEMAKITVWGRILFHIGEGKVITMDTESRVMLWDDVPSA